MSRTTAKHPPILARGPTPISVAKLHRDMHDHIHNGPAGMSRRMTLLARSRTCSDPVKSRSRPGGISATVSQASVETRQNMKQMPYEASLHSITIRLTLVCLLHRRLLHHSVQRPVIHPLCTMNLLAKSRNCSELVQTTSRRGGPSAIVSQASLVEIQLGTSSMISKVF